jgi:large subunit ribosomal protein L9
MNVLLPQKKAVAATPQNLKQVEKEALAAKGKKDMSAILAQKALAQIDGKTLSIKAKANPSGGLFESIKEKHINEAIENVFSISLPESAINLDEPIKKTGSYTVPVQLQGATAKITLTIG